MKGAIIGDIVGSVYEWDNIKTKDFPLFSEKSKFTDDTVCTVAVMDALDCPYEEDGVTSNFHDKDYTEWAYHSVERSLVKFGTAYPRRGYGGKFRHWLYTNEHRPYGSWGNGAPMRCSAAGWVTDDPLTAMGVGVVTALPTHNHIEGTKAAGLLAELICMARQGVMKDELLAEAEKYYFIPRLDDIRDEYDFDVSCMGTMPVALAAFFEGEDFEDAIRNAISVGGDSDTIACITGSLAEAYWGVPEDMWERAKTYLDDSLIHVVDNFYATYVK